jgi:hypothetical protein
MRDLLGRIAAFSAVSLVLLWGPATTAQTAPTFAACAASGPAPRPSTRP